MELWTLTKLYYLYLSEILTILPIYDSLKVFLPFPVIIALPIYEILPLSLPTLAILPSPTIKQGKVGRDVISIYAKGSARL